MRRNETFAEDQKPYATGSGPAYNRLDGGGADDTLIGGAGTDVLIGGSGADTFKWNAGDEGTEAVPALDTVADFDLAANSDKLDLQDLLEGEQADAAILDDFLDFSFNGAATTIDVHTQGASGGVYQQIVLLGVDLTMSGGLSDQPIIDNLLTANQLLVDL